MTGHNISGVPITVNGFLRGILLAATFDFLNPTTFESTRS